MITSMLKNLSTAIIIRFHYEADDPRFGWRFAFFQSVVLPRLLNQTDQNFDIAIRCNAWHDELFKSLSPKIRVFHCKDEFVSYTKNRTKKYFQDFIPWSNVLDLPKYHIQIGLDSDDLVSLDYVETIKKTIAIYATENNKIHIHFQPKLLRLENLTFEEMPTYDDTHGSAFMAFYQSIDTPDYVFINEYSHLVLPKHATMSIKVNDKQYVYAVAHYHNESTGK